VTAGQCATACLQQQIGHGYQVESAVAGWLLDVAARGMLAVLWLAVTGAAFWVLAFTVLWANFGTRVRWDRALAKAVLPGGTAPPAPQSHPRPPGRTRGV
jgi:hypothetical protein